MEKITLKEITGYLPYHLEVMVIEQPLKSDVHKLSGINYDGLASLGEGGRFGFIQRGFDKFKPILYPLEMLTKEIVHNGETFIPLIELAKIEAGEHNVDEICTDIEDEGYAFSVEYLPSWFTLYFNKKYCSFSRYDDGEGKDCCQNDLREKLHEWHFDIHGLIPRGLAIDKSTLNSQKNW